MKQKSNQARLVAKKVLPMNVMLRKYLSFLMAVVVLTASTGFGVVEHHCLMRGKSLHLAALQKEGAKGCQENHSKAPVSEKTSLQKQDCCADVQSYENVDISSSLSQWVAKIIKVATDAAIGAVIAAFQAISSFVFPEEDASSNLFSFSSLFHGRALLSFVQSFLI
ncbi:MAG: hypothetical protein R2822_22190 [Spirosomataceae bacterium]